MARGHTVSQEVLQSWREAERLLDELHPLSPDREPVRLLVDHLHQTFQTVVANETAHSPASLAAAYLATSDARRILTSVRIRRLQRLSSR